MEERLRELLRISVIDDDQHGTATVVLVALIDAFRVVGKPFETSHIVVSDAAGTAVTRLLLAAGAQDVTVWAPVGVLHPGLDELLPEHKRWLVHHTNRRRIEGGLRQELANADAVVGVSAPGVLTRALIKKMARAPIVLALARPDPGIDPG